MQRVLSFRLVPALSPAGAGSYPPSHAEAKQFGRLICALAVGLSCHAVPASAITLDQCVDHNPNGRYECEYQPQILDEWRYLAAAPGTGYSRSLGNTISVWTQLATKDLSICMGPGVVGGGNFTTWDASTYWLADLSLSERSPITISAMLTNPKTGGCEISWSLSTFIYRYRTASCTAGWVRGSDGGIDFCYRQRIRSFTTCYPIALGSGEKYLFETDYPAVIRGGLEFRRRYRSGSMGSGLEAGVTEKWREFGPYWRHNYQAGVVTGIGGSGDVAVVNRMGDRQYFSRGDAQSDGRTAWVSSDGGRSDRLYSHPASGGATQWEFYAPDNTLDVFVGGQLVSRATPDGRIQTLSGGDQIATVTDSFGRQLHFERDGGRLSGLRLPDGAQITFQYALPDEWDSTIPLAGANTYHNLVAVTYPGSASRHYHYAETDHTSGYPMLSALTGITDESGRRYSDYYYNGIRATRSVIGGIFSTSVSGWSYTDPLGASHSMRTTTVNGEQRIAGANQPAGSGCGASSSSITYDTAGNVASRRDFAGHRTTYSYDLSRNLETSRVEGYGTAQARTISSQWHPVWHLVTRRAEAKKLTTWVYNGQPDPSGGSAACAPSDALLPDGQPIAVLCKKIEQATTDATGASGFSAATTGSPRVWTWTYNRFGQVLTADGPRSDVNDITTYTYYTDTTADHTRGDLESVTDPLGHVTRYSRYDPNGRVLEIVDPNGLVTTLSYTARGWLKTRQVGAELTSYDYDAVGQLKKVTAADGSWIGYGYDDAHRLTDITDNRGNRIRYTLDAAGNRTQEDVSDPDGHLARSQSRIYDALSRLQNVIQPQ